MTSTHKVDLRVRVAMPPSVIVASLGTVGVALGLLATSVVAVITSDYEVGAMVAWVLTFSVGPAVAVWGLRRGWKVSPMLVTLIGLWVAPTAIFSHDALSIASGLAGIAAIIAVWSPSARRYRFARRAARAES